MSLRRVNNVVTLAMLQGKIPLISQNCILFSVKSWLISFVQHNGVCLPAPKIFFFFTYLSMYANDRRPEQRKKYEKAYERSHSSLSLSRVDDIRSCGSPHIFVAAPMLLPSLESCYFLPTRGRHMAFRKAD